MKIKSVLMVCCFVMLISLLATSTHALAQENEGYLKSPVSGQVGMYSYRVTDLLGYTKMDSQGQEMKKIVIQRDDQGSVVKKTHYDQNGVIKLEIAYRFDAEHRLTEKIKQTPQGKPLKINHYTYDSRKNMCTHVSLDGNGTLLKTHFYYFNKEGERIRKTTYNAKNQLLRTQLYIFDGSGRRIKDYTLTVDGSISRSTAYSYDENGFMECIQYFDEDFKLKGKSLIAVDTAGRPEKKSRFDVAGKLKYSTQYDY